MKINELFDEKLLEAIVRRNKMNIDETRIKECAVIHGEVILLPVTEIPAEAKESFHGPGFVAGHSETGHHHVIDGSVRAFALPKGGDTQEIYFRADADTQIRHLKAFDRHEDKPIAGGVPFIVLHASEYDLFENVMRKVVD
jgi:hypothetical protein